LDTPNLEKYAELPQLTANELNQTPILIVPQNKLSRAESANNLTGYLSNAGDQTYWTVSINPGVQLHAYMQQPNAATIDYDLYLLDENSAVVSQSENYTYLNNGVTLPECVSVVNTSSVTKTYYVLVKAWTAGSISQPFKLAVVASNPYDSYESAYPAETADTSLQITLGTGGSTVSVRSISSRIDNDWYYIDVPSSRSYDKLSLTLDAISNSQSFAVEVYQNISPGYLKLISLDSQKTIAVSTGRYYVRVFLTNDPQTDLPRANAVIDNHNYTLSLKPVLKAAKISITGYADTKGGSYVSGYGFGYHFRAHVGTLTVYGQLLTADNYAVTNTQVTAEYYNDSWVNTAVFYHRTGIGMTDSNGQFAINIDLPSGVGTYSDYVTVSRHYYDIAEIIVHPSDSGNIKASDCIYHFAYSI
jgi:hypothetical protein